MLFDALGDACLFGNFFGGNPIGVPGADDFAAMLRHGGGAGSWFLFMTVAWYGHLRYRSVPITVAIAGSWFIALGEYCLQVPANRIGYGQFSAYQLKIIQECVTLVVFVPFMLLFLGEKWRWDFLWAFFCILGAVFFIFRPDRA